MSPVHEHVASLLGAWALGACSDEETRLIMDHVFRCPGCREEALLFGGVTELLGGMTPRPSLRERTLASARARRPAAPSVPTYAAPYAAQMSVLDALLAELPPGVWSTTVIDDWNVQDVVAHLSATDGLLAEQLEAGVGSAENASAEILAEILQAAMARADGAHSANDGADKGHGATADENVDAPSSAAETVANVPGTDRDLADRTALAIAQERAREPSGTRATWRAQAEVLCAHLNEELSTGLVRLRFPMKVANALVQRAFETWIHARDIAMATGHSLPSPSMASFLHLPAASEHLTEELRKVYGHWPSADIHSAMRRIVHWFALASDKGAPQVQEARYK